jgi:hypothetical protein
MKLFASAVLAILLFAAIGIAPAGADTPPSPGSVADAPIESTAAAILGASLTEAPGPLPAEYVFKTACGQTINQGVVHLAMNGRIRIACAAYYCSGHKAICHLRQQF